ncbi:MAG: hypothetical protein JWM80_5834 [Cyanobacteria bacterium RYN_339]|nr:hypothetical protein [Cyanobacteria bacterium RYN_339]
MKTNVLAVVVAMALIECGAGSALAKSTPQQAPVQPIQVAAESFQIAEDDADMEEPAEDPSDDAEESPEEEAASEAAEDGDDPDEKEE